MIIRDHEPWGQELVYDERKTHQDPRRATEPAQLRSAKPAGVIPEIHESATAREGLPPLGFTTCPAHKKSPAPPEGAGHSQGERRSLVIRLNTPCSFAGDREERIPLIQDTECEGKRHPLCHRPFRDGGRNREST